MRTAFTSLANLPIPPEGGVESRNIGYAFRSARSPRHSCRASVATPLRNGQHGRRAASMQETTITSTATAAAATELQAAASRAQDWFGEDRKSTRLNSSHLGISY